MKVSGFTFIKNALIYDYPIQEAIRSILPLCDEMVVAVGKSDDDTLSYIQDIDPLKIKIIETEWDESQREGGRVLALETDKAFAAISSDADWAFYIQGDEVVHEKYLPVIQEAMERDLENIEIDGLLFKYLHFYGSYDYVGASTDWYRREIRIIRNDHNIYSYRDAQGFRKGDNLKLTVRPIDAYIYHYGWVKDPRAMQLKQENFHKYWHDDQWIQKNVLDANEYDYSRNVKELKPYEGSHPTVMQQRIDRMNWKFDHDISYDRRQLKDRLKKYLRNQWGIDLGYRNYKVFRD